MKRTFPDGRGHRMVEVGPPDSSGHKLPMPKEPGESNKSRKPGYSMGKSMGDMSEKSLKRGY